VLRNPDLANTYRLLASHGPSYLYDGPLGQAIVRADDHPAPAPAGNEGMHTNNVVTADKWGDVVGYTNTINFFGGSGETVPGYGFLLNNEMTGFDFAPPAPGAYNPNLPAGGKQPRSSMGPAIALAGGTPAFTVGAAGGSTIPTTILQIILNHVDLGMPLPTALAEPPGQPAELAHFAGRARLLQQRPRQATDQPFSATGGSRRWPNRSASSAAARSWCTPRHDQTPVSAARPVVAASAGRAVIPVPEGCYRWVGIGQYRRWRRGNKTG
jgi:gamma-glutamyltranspeptidase